MTGFGVARDDDSAAFFDAAAAGRLLVKRCPACGTFAAPPAKRCADGTELEWGEAAGTGRLVTWAVDHAAPLDAVLAAPDGSTAVFGLVELDEGPWLQVPIVGAAPDALSEWGAVHVVFVRPGGGEAVPAFTPD